jgi:competence protein ComEC
MILTSCAETSRNNIDYENRVSVVFINVGKADGILLAVNDKAYLIDTGSKQSVPALYRALSVMGIKKIDGLFLTHTHSDHIGGTEALLQKYRVDKLYSAEISQKNKKGENKIVQLAEELGLAHIKLKAGDSIEVEDGIAFKVIAPIEYNDENDNDNSLVLVTELNGKRFLFTGDMQFAEENTVLGSGADIDSDLLKVGNHGNPDATSIEFVRAVSPEYAVISTDTQEDKNSANPIVTGNLNPAKTFITQDYFCGIKIDVDNKGEISAGGLEIIKSAADMEILNIDTKAQEITIRNNGQQTDLSGYFIFSERGSEIFIFPDGAVIYAGQIITIACTDGEGDYIWNEKNVWNKKNTDVGVLYDRFGDEIARKRSL